MERAILEAYRRIGGGAVAVRSSATAEDLPEAAFAGQQETFLGYRERACSSRASLLGIALERPRDRLSGAARTLADPGEAGCHRAANGAAEPPG